MIYRNFGRHGFRVSALGYGAGPLGDARLDEHDVARLLHGALDLGIALFDTAPSYGVSEQRLGRHLAGQRTQVILSTKLGYGVEGVPDWTGPCIAAGIDAALARLRTDWLDIAHLHSCPPETLKRDDVLKALEDAVRDGKVRVAAYAGDGDGLRVAKGIALFGAFQVSHNLVDQEALQEGLPRGAGVIGKRALMNAAFARSEAETLDRPDVAAYRARWNVVRTSLPAQMVSGQIAIFALRFAAHAPGLSSCLVGTTRLENLRANVAAVEAGPLGDDERRALLDVWSKHRWPGLV